ncbi:MAG: DNA repair protein RecN [Actinomycetes bacterium]
MGSKKDFRPTLDEIAIRGLGVIESASISFSPGFTAITGETGAGKTMVLTALGLITGARADSDFVRSGAERSVVSAQFSVDSQTAEKVLDSGAEVDGNVLTIARSVSIEGKSRITMGGILTTTSKVHEICADLLEIHAQSSSLRLSKQIVQRELLDSFGELQGELAAYSLEYEKYSELQKRIAKLISESSSAQSQIRELREFVTSFAAVMPRSGELAEIDNEINRLGSVEEIHAQLSHALNILESDESGTLNNLKAAKKSLDQLLAKDTQLDPHIERFAELIYTVEDVASELVSYLARLEADPKRFEQLQLRKQSINALIKKFGVGTDKELAYERLIVDYSEAEIKMSDLDGGAERVAELEAELTEQFKSLKKVAATLHQSRVAAAVALSESVSKELDSLSMPNAQVKVEVVSGSTEEFSEYTSFGYDDVTFLFSPHVGSKLLPLSKIASGGEMSRLMLAIEIVLAHKSPVGTYIFDEVDSGVGGKAAVEVGRRLSVLSKTAQVIVVTHLPQVAVWADNHLLVSKDQSGSITQSSVNALNSEERRKEIARMLSGQEDSLTAQTHAEELLRMVSERVIS